MKQRRFLVLHLPRLATDRIRQREPALRDAPIATWETVGNRRQLVVVDAPGTTLRDGQALADAQAMHPELVLRPAEAEADLAFLERLALWAVRFTPLVAIDAPDELILDVTGCTDLFGGEESLLARVVASLEAGAIKVRAVLAGNAAAAAALARSGQHGKIVPSGEEAMAVAELPLAALRLPADCLTGLHRLGLQRIGDLARQPRAPLRRRFGRPLLDALDAVTGDRPRPLSPVRPPPDFMAAPSATAPGHARRARMVWQALNPLPRVASAASAYQPPCWQSGDGWLGSWTDPASGWLRRSVGLRLVKGDDRCLFGPCRHAGNGPLQSLDDEAAGAAGIKKVLGPMDKLVHAPMQRGAVLDHVCSSRRHLTDLT